MKSSHQIPQGHTVHVAHPQQPDANANTGYVETDYKHQEYPKHVHGKIVNNAEEEKAAQPKE